MRTNKNLLAVSVAIICCVIVVWFSTSIQGSQKTYELQPELTIPEYQTDTARIIDAYERLMERYMDLTEKNLAQIGIDLKGVVKKMDTIDRRLTELSGRMARIEKALGIEPPKKPIGGKLKKQTEYRDNKMVSESEK